MKFFPLRVVPIAEAILKIISRFFLGVHKIISFLFILCINLDGKQNSRNVPRTALKTIREHDGLRDIIL